jgi:hypothetical protein
VHPVKNWIQGSNPCVSANSIWPHPHGGNFPNFVLKAQRSRVSPRGRGLSSSVTRNPSGDRMANILPDGWRALEATGAAAREIETLASLAEALPDAYTVYHAVHWTHLEHGFSVYGEIDFVVVNLSGDVLLIEQKSGFLIETPQGLVKRYAQKEKSVPM